MTLIMYILRLISGADPGFQARGAEHVFIPEIIHIAYYVKFMLCLLSFIILSSKNVIFKCKNYLPHLLFHVQIVFFRNSFFRHLNKALII
jgi:hypothetical protein